MLLGRILNWLCMVRGNGVSLEGRYANDPKLLVFYKKKLLEPGWSGELNPDEFRYIRSQLWQSSSLKRRWGFKPSARRLSDKRIWSVAREMVYRQKTRG